MTEAWNYSVECITVDGCNDLESTVKISEVLNNNAKNNLTTNFPNNGINSKERKDEKTMQCNNIIELLTIIKNADNKIKFDSLTNSEKYKIVKELVDKYFPNIPETLRMITTGTLFNGDCERQPDDVPSWLDREKFARGQKFARDNLFGLFFAELLSLFLLFSFEDGLKPMIVTGKSSDPYTSFKRYLSTGNRVRNWYTSDPWTKGSRAYRDIQTVRRMHASVRNRLNNSSNEEIDTAGTIAKTWSSTRDILLEDFQATCPMALPGQCPYTTSELRSDRPKGLNQGEMSATQCGFVCLIILFPEKFGVHQKNYYEDLEAFCHLWRGIGYLLGIEDEFNFCQGTLVDVRNRSMDFLHYWVKPNLRNPTAEWEHMMRCVHEGMHYYFPGSSYEMNLLFLTELMELHMPRLRSQLTTPDWIRFITSKLLLGYGFQIEQLKSHFNARLNHFVDRALKYDERVHEKLREKSRKTLNNVLRDNNSLRNINNNNNKSENENDGSSISMKIISQCKFLGLLVLFAQFVILWRVNLLSG